MCLQIIESIVIFLYHVLFLFKNILTYVKYNKSTKIDSKIVVITGGSTGIGKACAIDLAKRGGKIYIACRNESINEQAFEDIRRKSGSQNIYFLELDLASLKSIKKFSEKFHQLENRLDILINNAGVMIPKKQLTEDGFEMHMGVNYLGHFLLTNLVIDMLKVSAPSRIILVSSIAHKISSLKQKDLMSNRSFSMFKAYGMSKLAIILFTKELSRKLEGTQITVNCCNPGVANTSIIQYILGNVAKRIYSFLTKEPEEAAQNYIKLAVDPDLESVSGKYFEYCVEKEPSTEANDIQTAKWLWDKSVELVKFKC